MADVAADTLRILAQPARLRILALLREGERSVRALERELVLKQPGLSQRLGELRQAGLVATRREAKSVFYRLADARIARLIAVLEQPVTDEDDDPTQRASQSGPPQPREAAVFAQLPPMGRRRS